MKIFCHLLTNQIAAFNIWKTRLLTLATGVKYLCLFFDKKQQTQI